MYKTLITGAGSSISVEDKAFYGGFKLLNQVLKMVSIDNKFRENLQRSGFDENTINYFFIELTHFMVNSRKSTIDEFISELMYFPEHSHLREDLVKIGKYAVFYCICEMEYEFKKSYKPGAKTSWLDLIKDDYNDNPSHKIITFNYDRLIEFLLDKEGKKIFHVYHTIKLEHWKFGEIPNSIHDFGKHLGDWLIANDRVRYPKQNDITGFDHVIKHLQPLNFIFGFSFDMFNVRNVGLTNNAIRNNYCNLFDEIDAKKDDYKTRRELTHEVRKSIPEAYFSYFSSEDFIKEVYLKTQYEDIFKK